MTPPKLYGMDPVTQHGPGNASDKRWTSHYEQRLQRERTRTTICRAVFDH